MLAINIHTDPLSALQDKMKTLLRNGDEYNRIVQNAMATILDTVKARIHEQGLAADGGDIGTYSTKPLYISQSTNASNVLTTATGKTGKSVFKGGKKAGLPHVSQYFGNGYSGYKTTIGLNQSGKVNLFLSGRLENQLIVMSTSTGYGLGWQEDKFYSRAITLEDKYGKVIYGLTADEKNKLKEVLQTEMQKTFA